MPYKDPADQRAAHKRWAEKNPEAVKASRNKHSQTPGRKAAKKKKSAEIKARNRSFVNEAKNIPCADCDIKYPAYVMDFDHVSGIKKGDISDMANSGFSIKALEAEIAKCEVVCANCHRERTHGEDGEQDPSRRATSLIES